MSSCRLVVASPPRRRGPQARAPWHHEVHGAVDVVGPVAPLGCASGHGWGTQECTQISENGLSAPFRVICVHCCTVMDRRENAGVYTNRRKRSLGAVLGHLCTLLRRDSPRRQSTLTPEEPNFFALRADPKERVCKESDHPSDTYRVAQLDGRQFEPGKYAGHVAALGSS